MRGSYGVASSVDFGVFIVEFVCIINTATYRGHFCGGKRISQSATNDLPYTPKTMALTCFQTVASMHCSEELAPCWPPA